MSGILNPFNKKILDVDDFVIKKDALPFIYNVFIVHERLINGNTVCRFLCPIFQDQSKLPKSAFTDGFLVRTEDLIPAHVLGLYVVNPLFEIDMYLQSGKSPQELPERLKPIYDSVNNDGNSDDLQSENDGNVRESPREYARDRESMQETARVRESSS